MRASTLPRYLLGSRDAIIDIVASKRSIVIGLLFVLSAGLAREYDGEDLIHEPWHILRPLAASLISGTVLFALVQFIAEIRAHKIGETLPPPGEAWRSFMSLFWMTAPLAWLYAVPYERFMTPVAAVEANLWTLAAVSVWRVLLITRAISVLYGVSAITVFFIVMLFADGVAMIAVQLAPVPVIDMMGGIRHSPEDQVLANAATSVFVYGILTAPIWIVGALAAIVYFRPQWLSDPVPERATTARGMGVLAVLSLVAFISLAAVTQPEQVRRHKAERLFSEGRVAEALEYMSRHDHGDFPPHWDPPPRVGYSRRAPNMEPISSAMAQSWPADWVAAVYLDKIRTIIADDLGAWTRERTWLTEDDSDSVKRKQDFFADLQRHRAAIEFLREHDASLSDEDRDAIDALLSLISPPQSGAEDGG